MEAAKPWYQSKTIWFNIGMFALALIDPLVTGGVLTGKAALIASVVGNTALRSFSTSQPIS